MPLMAMDLSFSGPWPSLFISWNQISGTLLLMMMLWLLVGNFK